MNLNFSYGELFFFYSTQHAIINSGWSHFKNAKLKKKNTQWIKEINSLTRPMIS